MADSVNVVMHSELTICSVYHSAENRKLLELNWDFACAMNPEERFAWIVADNSPPELKEKIDGTKFQVIPGVRQDEVPAYARPWMRGSYHHTLAIHKSLPYVQTRFALFLDSDFYIVRPGWATDVTRYMKKNNLAFFGVPWHPRHIKKYRYFPAIHSLFVDLRYVNKRDLNFLPQYEELLGTSFRNWLMRKLKRVGLSFISKDRRGIGTSRDSGYDVFRRFSRDARTRFECSQPVFLAARDLAEHPTARAPWSALLENFLPDRYCYIPKRKGYYTEIGFAERGSFDAAGRGWEEFVWKRVPFGFHLRGIYRSASAPLGQDSFAEVRQALAHFRAVSA